MMQTPEDLEPKTYYAVTEIPYNGTGRTDLGVYATLKQALAAFAEHTQYTHRIHVPSGSAANHVLCAGNDNAMTSVVELVNYVGVWTNANPRLDYGYCFTVREQDGGRVLVLPERSYGYQVGRFAADWAVTRDVPDPLGEEVKA